MLGVELGVHCVVCKCGVGVSSVFSIKWRTDERIGGLASPVLFIVGDQDEIVPSFHSKKLHELAAGTLGSRAQLYTVHGGSHNDCFDVGGDRYLRRVADFLNGHVGK
jgi:fermentation-respiration switch protein FrsA (DUF1100 family)